MKDQRVGTVTFLPLDTIRTTPVKDTLRTLGKHVYPIIDVLNYDRVYQRAMEYVCGTTLVVDTLDQA